MKSNNPSNSRWHFTTVTVLSLVATVTFIGLKIYQYKSHTGIGSEIVYFFETMFYNYINGNGLQTNHPFHYFAEHFSPVLFLFIPFYYFFQSPYFLLLAQGLICGLAVVPLYFLANKYFKDSRFIPVTFCLIYFFSRVVNYGLMYEFHMEVLYPALFFSIFLFYEKKSWVWYYVFMLLALSVKEDAAFVILGFAVFVFLKGEKKHGAYTFAFALIWLIVSVGFIIPYYRALHGFDDYKFLSYWTHYGATKAEIILNMLNPVKNFEVLFSGKKPSQMFNLFSVFLFLPFFSLKCFLFLVVPNIFILYSSNNEVMNAPLNYYGLLITPFLFYASMIGLKNLEVRFKLSRKVILIICSILLAVNIANSRYFKIIGDGFEISERYKIFEEFKEHIPGGSVVVAQENIIAHIHPSNKRILFPNKKEYYAEYTIDIPADYVIIDTRGNRWPLEDVQFDKEIDLLKNEPSFETIFDYDGLIVFKRISPNE